MRCPSWGSKPGCLVINRSLELALSEPWGNEARWGDGAPPAGLLPPFQRGFAAVTDTLQDCVDTGSVEHLGVGGCAFCQVSARTAALARADVLVYAPPMCVVASP